MFPWVGRFVWVFVFIFISEEREYERKLLKRAPGIPPDLARCYVWYFAEGQ